MKKSLLRAVLIIWKKIVVPAGNIDGISSVNDRIKVTNPPSIKPKEPEKQLCTVKKGDYLSKIAKEVYEKANKYNIFLRPTSQC